MADTQIGQVVHFYDKIQVAIVKLTGSLKVGDTVKFKHADQEFDQPVDSMEIKHQKIEVSKKGDEVGIKVTQPVKENFQVFKTS